MRIIYFALAIIILSSCVAKKEVIAKKEMAEKRACWAHIDKAIELREKKDFQGAIAEIELKDRCTTSKIKMPYYYHLGWTYHEMGEYQKAIDSYTKGLETQPDYPFAYWRRGLAYEKLGDLVSAHKDYALAYEVGMKIDSKKFLQTLDENPEVKEKLIRKK